jgi:hypothetical protein
MKRHKDGKHIHTMEQKNTIALDGDNTSDAKEEYSSLFEY